MMAKIPYTSTDEYHSSQERHLLASRLKEARSAAQLTQEQLAGATYSKSYISAIERGKMTPSLPALGRLAERLGQPMSYFLGESDIDLSALAESGTGPGTALDRERIERKARLGLMLDEAVGLLRQHDPVAALEKLGATETVEALSVLQRPRWYLLQGWAWFLKGAPHRAITLLEQGMQLVERLRAQAPRAQHGELTELAEQLRCFLGLAYSGVGQIEVALVHHRRGLAAVQQGLIGTPELALRIALALAQDLLRLDQCLEASKVCEDTIKQADEAEGLVPQGVGFWQRGLAAHDCGDLPQALANMQKALVAFGVQENMRLAALLRVLFGQVLLSLSQYEAAEANLRHSLEEALRIGDATTQGLALCTFASLLAAKGEHDQAISLAHQGLAVVQASHDSHTEGHLHLALAIAYEARSADTEAEAELEQAISSFAQAGAGVSLEQAQMRKAQFLATRRRFEEAYTLLVAAVPSQRELAAVPRSICNAL